MIPNRGDTGPGVASAWLDALNAYNYAVDLSLFVERGSFPKWFTNYVDGARGATKAFEDRFRTLADHHLEVWYEGVFWKMFSQNGRRDQDTIDVVRNIESAGISADKLYDQCCAYIQQPTKRSLQSFVELLWGKGARTVAIACIFPPFIAPDRFPMVDTRVAKWVIACLEKHNAADPHGPQLVLPAYPSNHATVLTLSDWPFIESWISWCRHTGHKLTSLTGLDWRARDVEMAIFRAWGDRDERKKGGGAKDRPLIDLPPLGTT
jgi:hypothetical protein